MFDISFSELMLLGVIALIVIGPERLPKVARTIGHLLGRAQKYVNEVKSDIQNEMDLKEIGNIKKQMEEAAQSVKSSINASVDEVKSTVSEPATSIKDSLDEAKAALNINSEPAAKPEAEIPEPGQEIPANPQSDSKEKVSQP